MSKTKAAPVVLTKQERTVLKMICAQKTNKMIAHELALSPRTIDGHRNNLIKKSKAENVVGLVLYAVRHEIIDLNDPMYQV